ncbi:EI24 domain-containing protein [Massilia sp. R2A-15]|uniref:EI24 domain-containing protein n=1 Tax=Massilia sp. R2A-15 TaxID=3064278 RepID=UPI002733AC39|nr:EI24 domain-containing protein [Massilia sp. R2A-15]WLI89969.1 EI24 domain-containing protein [Massilia sp. R2A-15]
MRAVLNAYGRALASQFSGRMLLLSIAPFLLSVSLWAVLLYFGFQPLVDYVQSLFADYGGFKASGSLLSMFGMGMLKTVAVPLVSMLLLLPLMIMTSLLFMGVAAMPAIARHVGARQFSTLEKKHGGSLAGSVLLSLGSVLLFLVLWICSLPLYLFPPAALVAQVVLWGWLTMRVMSYDALADYASADERRALMHARRWPLLAIGMLSGAAGALPGIVWIGGALISVVLFPFLAMISIWLYLVIFIFTGLWFQYYCLQALAELRADEKSARNGAGIVAN